jgi:hypothetical protein
MRMASSAAATLLLEGIKGTGNSGSREEGYLHTHDDSSGGPQPQGAAATSASRLVENFRGVGRTWRSRRVRFSVRKTFFKSTIWETEILELASAPGRGAWITSHPSSSSAPVTVPLQGAMPVEVDVAGSGSPDLRLVFRNNPDAAAVAGAGGGSGTGTGSGSGSGGGGGGNFLKLSFGSDRATRNAWRLAIQQHLLNGR